MIVTGLMKLKHNKEFLDGKTIGGAPATNIKLTLDFAETSLLTRQDIVEGH